MHPYSQRTVPAQYEISTRSVRDHASGDGLELARLYLVRVRVRVKVRGRVRVRVGVRLRVRVGVRVGVRVWVIRLGLGLLG